MKPIFVVEDEPDIASVLVDYLRAAGYEATHFDNGQAALDAALKDPPMLMVLDLMLPGRDGLQVLSALRESSNLPVVMLTARVEEVDRLLGLELGADDYICKPFSPREVVARVKAVLRRTQTPQPPSAGLQLDAERWRSALGAAELPLTRREFEVLQVLAARPGRILTRAQLLDLAYPDTLDANERVIDSHVKNIRRKLAAVDPDHEWIRSVYGVGFSFEPR